MGGLIQICLNGLGRKMREGEKSPQKGEKKGGKVGDEDKMGTKLKNASLS